MKMLVAVEGQTLRWYGKIPEIADNSVQFVQLEFSLPEDWADLVVVAQFSQTKTYNKPLENGCCYLPAELVAGPCEVSLFGQRAGENVRATSVPLRFKISRSGFTSTAETPIPPTPDLYAQLLEKLGPKGPSESVSVEDDGEGNVSFAPGFEGDGEDRELNSLNTGKTVYTSFSDKTARRELRGKLANPGGLTPGKLLKVKSVDENGDVVLEGVDMPSGGSSVTIDTTLTQSGQAADAKATGDEIKRVEGNIPSIEGLAREEDIPTKPEDIGAQPAGNYASPDDIPKVPPWAMQNSKPAYAASEVGADPTGTAAAAVSAHNTNTNAHNDIRQELAAINARLTAFFDSDNQTLDELSEIVAYITSNKSLIDAITTSKVSVADIVNNLTTNVANKPLSAAQGVAIKALIDAVSNSLNSYALKTELPTKLSQLSEDSTHRMVTDAEKTAWNAKSSFSGKYTDLSGKPTKVSEFTNDAGYLTEHQDISGKADKFDPTVYGLPVIWLTGDTAPIAVSKDNKVTLNYVYGDRSGSCTLKGQGATSYKTAQALVKAGKAGKFNYTIKFDNAFEAKEGWGAQQKYCLKANFIDPTHSRNICSCKLWGMSVKARSVVPAELANLPNGGAIDGFPIIIMLNGEFHGLYTWNIPKDGWMFGLVEDLTKTQAIVSASDHTVATQFKEASMAGFEVEFVSDEDNADWVEQSMTRMIAAVINSDGSDLDTTVAQYLDWDSWIDHFIQTVVEKATDCVDKNYNLVTFDGIKWYVSVYDRDSDYGLEWDASGLSRPVSNCSFTECAATVRVYELILRFKTDRLKARYKELRGNILSESRIDQVFENFAWAIPSPVMIEDVKRYPTIKGSSVNTIDQIGRFVSQRLPRCDEWIDELPAQEEPPAPEPEEPDIPVGGYTNLVPTSTDTDGSIYNGTGYKDGVRLSSSGGVSSTSQSNSCTTGFMPWQSKGVIRIKGAEFLNSDSSKHYYANFYNADKSFNYYFETDADGAGSGAYSFIKITKGSDGVTTVDLSGASTSSSIGNAAINAAFFRITVAGSGADLIVTVNQEITE